MSNVLKTNSVWNKSYADQIIQPNFHGHFEAPRSQRAEPIKDLEDIQRVRDYILDEREYRQEEMRYRDNLLFVMGVNFGLRAGDLLKLKLGHVLDERGKLRKDIYLIEEKTAHTRGPRQKDGEPQKPRRVIRRLVHPNDSIAAALDLYLRDRQIDVDDPLFRNMSNNNSMAYLEKIAQNPQNPNAQGKIYYRRKTDTQQGITPRSAERILKSIIMDEVGLNVHASTHLLRKTFAYQVLMAAPAFEEGLLFVQSMLQHSSQQMTLRYLGLEGEAMRDVYMTLNLGDRVGPVMRDEGDAKIIELRRGFAMAAGLEVVA